MSDNESRGVNGLLSARIKELEIELADLRERNKRLEERDDKEEEACNEVHGTLATICDLIFDDEERASTHGYEGVVDKIIDTRNQLSLHKLLVKRYCDDFCALSESKGEACYTCPLAKL